MSTALAQLALTIASAVFDSLWEGALIGGFVWLTLRCLPQLGAATRYAIWLCALAALVVVPIVTVTAAARPAVHAADAGLSAERNGVSSTSTRVPVVAQPQVTVTKRALDGAIGPVAAPVTPVAPRIWRITISQSLALAVAGMWLLATGVRMLLLLLDLRALAAIRRGARPWSSAYEYPVYVSRRVSVPIAAGFLMPAIIVPEPLADALAADAIETIVAHEVAHLRRYDVWTNAVAHIAEALLALNPAAWFIMRQISTQREIACDDWVVARTGSGAAFANVLATLAGVVRRGAPLGAPSALGSRHSLVMRIERLLDARPRRLRLSGFAIASTVVSLAVVALLMQTVAPVLAYDRSRPVAARPPSPRGEWPCWIAKGGTRVIVVPARPSKRLRFRPANAVATGTCSLSGSKVRARILGTSPFTGAFSTVVPAYPSGWSARYPAACKVPSLIHAGVPAVPASLRRFSPNMTLTSSVRVDVDEDGAVTKADIVSRSGARAFDAAVLSAARQHTYPLAESSGFREVRPANAPSSWNAAHGAESYAACTPLPRSYVWTATLERGRTILTFLPRSFVRLRKSR